ncbi:turripeptide Lol9.1-like [Nilaparvata lugens]|uniref:turripeptide Lol9.1-like n=1 Tax=Nilaparvata lugens TaxID=108931 RepID=UPI00193EA711|nr:turripeptide Lol9.1-like [Nilaparvata lugens]
MNSFSLIALFLLGLMAVCISGQYGSVHCRVGCACASDYVPQCGSDRRTYDNECKLRCQQCFIPGLVRLFEGRCEDRLLLAPAAPLIPLVYYPSK